MIIFRRVLGGYLVKIRVGVPAVFVSQREGAVGIAISILEKSAYLLNA